MARLLEEKMIRSELVPVLSALLDDTLKAAAAAGRELDSAVLFGSAISKSYVPKKSDVNVFMVFDVADLPLLKELTPVMNRHYKKLRAYPVVIDRDFIANSTDVFPMEFLEWKERSRVIYGADPLEGVEISQDNLRLQIEENLRGKRMKLFQAFFEINSRKGKLQPFVEETLPNFTTVLRNLLRLLGEAPNRETLSVIDAVQEKTGVSLTSLRRFYCMKTDGVKVDQKEAEILFKGFLDELAELTRVVDSYDTGQ